MNWLNLALDLLAIAKVVFAEVEKALAAGKDPTVIHSQIVAHAADLPAKIAIAA